MFSCHKVTVSQHLYGSLFCALLYSAAYSTQGRLTLSREPHPMLNKKPEVSSHNVTQVVALL